MSKLLADIGKLRPAELTPLQTAVLGLRHPEYPELAEAAALELERLQEIKQAARDFMKVRPFIESIGDNLTNALLLRLVEALQAADRKPGG
jgi:hypothetical protein